MGLLQIPPDRRETGAPENMVPFHAIVLLGFKGCLGSLFALAKLVIEEQFLRRGLLINYQKRYSNCYAMFYSLFIFKLKPVRESMFLQISLFFHRALI